MSEYDFECGDCGEIVSIRATVKEMEEGLSCPKCGSRKLERVFTPITTLGGCMDSPSAAPG
ncbi:MAG: FmdB family zinc ribbon protein [Actinomycetota bacterium]